MSARFGGCVSGLDEFDVNELGVGVFDMGEQATLAMEVPA